jgi:hypothetical protein
MMLCARLNQWPYRQPPHQATAAQMALLAAAYVETLPKAKDSTESAPHGKLDKHTMKAWRENWHKRLEAEAPNGR